MPEAPLAASARAFRQSSLYITFTGFQASEEYLRRFVSVVHRTRYREVAVRVSFLRRSDLDARMKFLIAFLALASLCRGDVSHILEAASGANYDKPTTTTTQGPPNPYSYQYSAGRFPGHVDRVQSEAGDGTGRVQGSYSFIDPKFKIRTVQYTVDEHGFHPSLINYDDVLKQPTDSEAVRREKERHHILYEKIAARNSQGIPAQLPKDSVSVARAKNRHHNLFQKIAAEHAAIAAEREAARFAFEATSVANEVNESDAYLN